MEEKFSLKNKNIVITGASSGIGRECAIVCSSAGANIILIARNEDRLNETFNLLSEGDHKIFSIDLLELDKLETIISQSVSQIGNIHGFIHSAGLEMTIPLNSMKPKHYENLFLTNVVTGFELAKIISKKKHFNENGASFIFISSIMGLVGQSGKVGYCSSKGALIAGTKAMALELASKKIRVNCICPGVVETNMTKNMFEQLSEDAQKAIIKMHPLGLGMPEDVAYACLYLLSDASRWITGTNLNIDGGYSAG